ncbi:MAG: AI-2E family transporter [Hungatella sp.]|jgi:predicted PurR-regulated permease PerM|nr:AI-2E family transporter [Hungatella sp.]
MELKKETIVKLRGLIVFAVFAVVAGVNYQKLLGLIGSCVAMASPFLLGGAIAFILNVPMRAIERRTPIRKSKRFRRPISLCLAIALAVGVPAAVIIVVGPELFHTIESLQKTIPLFLEEAQNQAEDLFSRYPDMVAYISSVHIDWEQLGKQVMAFLSSGAGTMLASTLNAAVSIVSGAVSFGIGFVFAIYVLLQKENLARQIKRLGRAYLPENVYEKTLEVARLTERIFSNFLAGQCVEAVILGAMFFVTLTLLRLPYALLIGVLIAFTALIPIFGAFVGCGVGTFLILMVSPVKALIFLVVFQILQQLEGNLIYPHVVGGSVGLPSIWVLVAVTIGGSAMGVVGMLVFIPLCSVLYALLREAVAGRLQRKNQKTRQKGGAAKGKAAQAKT